MINQLPYLRYFRGVREPACMLHHLMTRITQNTESSGNIDVFSYFKHMMRSSDDFILMDSTLKK